MRDTASSASFAKRVLPTENLLVGVCLASVERGRSMTIGTLSVSVVNQNRSDGVEHCCLSNGAVTRALPVRVGALVCHPLSSL